MDRRPLRSPARAGRWRRRSPSATRLRVGWIRRGRRPGGSVRRCGTHGRVSRRRRPPLPTRPTRTPRRCWVARSRLPTGRCAGSARTSGMLRPISRRRAARRRKSKPRSANMKRSSVVRRGVSRMQSPRSWRARSTASSRRPRRRGGSSTTSMLFCRFWRTRRRRGTKRLTGLALRCRRRRRARLGPIINGAPRWRRGGRRVRRCCAMPTLRCHADSRGGITALGRNGRNGRKARLRRMAGTGGLAGVQAGACTRRDRPKL